MDGDEGRKKFVVLLLGDEDGEDWCSLAAEAASTADRTCERTGGLRLTQRVVASLRKLGGDDADGLVVAAVECLDVEACADLWEDLGEGGSHCGEVISLDTGASDVLVGQMVELLSQNIGVGQEVDDDVQAVGNSDQVRAPFTTGLVVDLDSLEQSLGLRVAVEHLLEDGTGDGNLAVSERRLPDFLPQELEFLSVLGRTAVVRCLNEGNGSHHEQYT